ncbi:MAG: hypothetical protein MJE68_11500, partial [Proteobacteria bacterium]|nr:hypothetical protein [Pseudomonadota bacterium]
LVRNFDGKTGADFALQITDLEVERSVIKFSDIRISYISRLLILSLLFSHLRLLVGGTSWNSSALLESEMAGCCFVSASPWFLFCSLDRIEDTAPDTALEMSSTGRVRRARTRHLHFRAQLWQPA